MIMKYFYMVGLMVLLAGCQALKPQKDSSRFYTLSESTQGKTKAVQIENSTPVLGVMMPVVPAYLERAQMVERKANGELRIDENVRWAEGLKEGFLRVLSTSLEEQTTASGWDIRRFPDTQDAHLLLIVEVQAFEQLDSGEAVLELVWRLEPQGEGRHIVIKGAFKHRVSAEDFPSMFAMRSLIEAFCKELKLPRKV